MAECPKCKGNFDPLLLNSFLGRNVQEDKFFYLYYNTCPVCNDMIIILRKYSSIHACKEYDMDDAITNGEFIYPNHK